MTKYCSLASKEEEEKEKKTFIIFVTYFFLAMSEIIRSVGSRGCELFPRPPQVNVRVYLLYLVQPEKENGARRQKKNENCAKKINSVPI